LSHFRPMIRTIPDHRGEIEGYSWPKLYGIPGDPDYRGTTVVELLVNFVPQVLYSSAEHGDKAAGWLLSQSV
jgi:hypothetical protein